MTAHNRGERRTRDGFDSIEDRRFLSSSDWLCFSRLAALHSEQQGHQLYPPQCPSEIALTQQKPGLCPAVQANQGLTLAQCDQSQVPGRSPCGLRRYESSTDPLLASVAWPHPQISHQSLAQHWSNVSFNDTDGCHTTTH